MATYQELYSLRNDDGFLQKVTVAVAVKAAEILDAASPSVAEVTWAGEAIVSPRSKANALAHYVLASNSTATVDAILNASDALVQTNVDSAVDVLITGGA